MTDLDLAIRKTKNNYSIIRKNDGFILFNGVADFFDKDGKRQHATDRNKLLSSLEMTKKSYTVEGLQIRTENRTYSFDKDGNRVYPYQVKFSHLLNNGTHAKIYHNEVEIYNKDGTLNRILKIENVNCATSLNESLFLGHQGFSQNNGIGKYMPNVNTTAIAVNPQGPFPVVLGQEDGKVEFINGLGFQENPTLDLKEKIESIECQNNALFVTTEKQSFLYPNKNEDLSYNFGKREGVFFNDSFLSQNQAGYVYLFNLQNRNSTFVERHPTIDQFRTFNQIFAVRYGNIINVLHKTRRGIFQTFAQKEFSKVLDFRITETEIIVLTDYEVLTIQY